MNLFFVKSGKQLTVVAVGDIVKRIACNAEAREDLQLIALGLI
ncbi:20166_t:CDS:1, partial [Dentiscutata erythropus]